MDGSTQAPAAAAAAVTTTAPTKGKKRPVWLDKPARRQIALSQVVKAVNPANFLENYNIWYNKSSNFDQSLPEPRKTRCDVEKDSGTTKANAMAVNRICTMFAHGCCPYGAECRFLHRIPLESDREEPQVDCFGRERFGSDRQDMGGVGTWSRENTTLYIGGVVSSDAPTEKMIHERYGPFGEIVSIRVLKAKPVAFVKFKRRSNAEFAREATQNMIWETGEVFNIRWANEDPNPRTKAEFLEDAKDRFFEAMKSKVSPDVMGQYVMMAQTEMAAESQIGVHGKNVRVTDFYPTTDSQYAQTPQSLEAMKYGYTAATYAQQTQQEQGADATTQPSSDQQYQGYYQGYDQQQYAAAYQQQQQQGYSTAEGYYAYQQQYGNGSTYGYGYGYGYDTSAQQTSQDGEGSVTPADPSVAATIPEKSGSSGGGSTKRKRADGEEGAHTAANTKSSSSKQAKVEGQTKGMEGKKEGEKGKPVTGLSLVSEYGSDDEQ